MWELREKKYDPVCYVSLKLICRLVPADNWPKCWTMQNGISELLAVNGEDYLVLERDGLAGTEAITKRIYRISTKDATDISAFTSLSGDVLPPNVVPAQKTLLLDLLDPRWGLAGSKGNPKVLTTFATNKLDVSKQWTYCGWINNTGFTRFNMWP